MKEGAPNPFPGGSHRNQERFPTVEVKNKVIWKNENLPGPFNFEIGKPSPLGLTFDLANPKESSGLSLGVRKGHGRSADIGPVYFKDSEDRLYRDLDLKGAGYAYDQREPAGWRRQRDLTGDERVNGLMEKEDALHDSEIAEELTKLGIRTHRSLAVIELEELQQWQYDEWGRSLGPVIRSVEEFHGSGLLPPDFVPVVQVRAFGIKTRLIELRTKLREEIRSDAIELLSRETDGNVHDLDSYLLWFSDTLGTQLSRLHKNGYTHGFVSSHNITVDCRLVDFDSVERRPVGDPEPVHPEYSSIEEEINAPPPPSVFWDAASGDYHHATAILSRMYGELTGWDEIETNELAEKMLIAFENAYSKENPASRMFLRWS